jgi:hypothetical protein
MERAVLISSWAHARKKQSVRPTYKPLLNVVDSQKGRRTNNDDDDDDNTTPTTTTSHNKTTANKTELGYLLSRYTSTRDYQLSSPCGGAFSVCGAAGVAHQQQTSTEYHVRNSVDPKKSRASTALWSVTRRVLLAADKSTAKKDDHHVPTATT